jgi:hypothetical protein
VTLLPISSVKAQGSLVQEATRKVQDSSLPDLLCSRPAVPFMQLVWHASNVPFAAGSGDPRRALNFAFHCQKTSRAAYHLWAKRRQLIFDRAIDARWAVFDLADFVEVTSDVLQQKCRYAMFVVDGAGTRALPA